MYFAGPYLITLGRVLLSIMFIQSGIMKIFGYAGTQAIHGLPGMLLPLVILVEAGGGLGVLGESPAMAAIQYHYLALGAAVLDEVANFLGLYAARARSIQVGAAGRQKQPVAAAQNSMAGIVEQQNIVRGTIMEEA